MAMTNAEKQAAHRDRKNDTIQSLSATVAMLTKENGELRIALHQMNEKIHGLEIKLLKVKAAR